MIRVLTQAFSSIGEYTGGGGGRGGEGAPGWMVVISPKEKFRLLKLRFSLMQSRSPLCIAISITTQNFQISSFETNTVINSRLVSKPIFINLLLD
jgi:hypothetical protein